jgi:hypothetical protein
MVQVIDLEADELLGPVETELEVGVGSEDRVMVPQTNPTAFICKAYDLGQIAQLANIGV